MNGEFGMKLGRRDFISCAAAMLIPSLCFSAERPRLRVGLLSDTHVNPDPASCERTRMAFETFKREKVDAIAHLGDLSNYHQIEAYRNYRNTMDTVFPDPSSAPEFLYAWGNHDSIDYERRANPKDRQIDRRKAFAVMKDILGIRHGLNFEMELGGYSFLGFPERITDSCSLAEFERRIAAACARDPGKPVFLLHHPPPYGTCDNSEKGCAHSTVRILERYPQVVSINGHKHTSVMNERSIWQGKFTVVQTSCLYNWIANWESAAKGARAQIRSGYGVMVMDVYDGRLEFRRFDVRYPDEMHAGKRWIVPVPFMAGQVPYALERRKASEKEGVFPGEACISVKPDRQFNWLTVNLTPVVNREDVRLYRIEACRKVAGGWERIADDDLIGDFDDPPALRKNVLSLRMGTAGLARGETYRFTAVPEGFFGRRGKTISCEWKA